MNFYVLGMRWTDSLSTAAAAVRTVAAPEHTRVLTIGSSLRTQEGRTEVLGEKPAPLPLCTPQILRLRWDWARTSAVRNRPLRAWALRQPCYASEPDRLQRVEKFVLTRNAYASIRAQSLLRKPLGRRLTWKTGSMGGLGTYSRRNHTLAKTYFHI
jgi:hypothetical protein